MPSPRVKLADEVAMLMRLTLSIQQVVGVLQTRERQQYSILVSFTQI